MGDTVSAAGNTHGLDPFHYLADFRKVRCTGRVASDLPIPSWEREEGSMITFLMMGLLVVLVFLCVSSSLSAYSGRRLL